MPTEHSIKFGDSVQTFRRSPTQVAVVATAGRGRARDFAIDALERRRAGERRERLGRFEIVDLEIAGDSISEERSRLSHNRAVEQVAPIYHTSEDNVPFVPEGTITVRFANHASADDISRLAQQYGITLEFITRGGAHVFRVPLGEDAVEAAARVQGDVNVILSQPDMVTPLRLLDFLPNDALLGKQWHLENRGEHNGTTVNFKAGADARIVDAWKILGNLGRSDVVIAIIDDGFDLTHPDLAGKQTKPRDFVRGGSDVLPQPDPFDPLAGDWHGTPCAGVALASSAAGDTVGVAPNAMLMPIRVRKQLSPHDIANWFDYATDNGAWIVSCSWGADAKNYKLDDTVYKAISRCATEGRNGKGCVVVFAAGNDNVNINDPDRTVNGFAIHPDVLAVSACTSVDTKADYSNWGKDIAVAAPSSGRGGWRITTIDVAGTYLDAARVARPLGYDPGAYYDGFRGTSSACPVVAGVCALVLSANPNLSAAEVRQIIKNTARQIPPEIDYIDGHSLHFGYGCVDASKAVGEALRLAGEV